MQLVVKKEMGRTLSVDIRPNLMIEEKNIVGLACHHVTLLKRMTKSV
jgi:hypothetical protein